MNKKVYIFLSKNNLEAKFQAVKSPYITNNMFFEVFSFHLCSELPTPKNEIMRNFFFTVKYVLTYGLKPGVFMINFNSGLQG